VKGILIHGGEDETIARRAKAMGLKVAGGAIEEPFEKTLIVEAGTRVPWDLLPAAWHFLERWDAAVPLWRYGVLAADVGTAYDRECTKIVIRDLRVLLHSVELLFVRRNEAGAALVETWQQEMGNDPDKELDKRLAFLRALYRVKPRLCVLPISWLAEVHDQSRRMMHRGQVQRPKGQPLVRVEVEPGRFVKCNPGDEEKVLNFFEDQRAGR